MDTPELTVVGPITRDLTLAAARWPDPGGSVTAEAQQIAVGGKGANPAVAAARLGARVRLIGHVGTDGDGDLALAQLSEDGLDLAGVRRLADRSTGTIAHLVEPGGSRRFVEWVGANGEATLSAAQPPVAGGRQAAITGPLVLVSTALPSPVVELAGRAAVDGGARLVADLAGPRSTNEAILGRCWGVRADATEAGELVGVEITDWDSAASAARELATRGPQLVIVEAGGDGDLFRYGERELRLTRLPVDVVDPTGGGDALIATFLVVWAREADLEAAARLAIAAAGHTVARLGGRPAFTSVEELARLADGASDG